MKRSGYARVLISTLATAMCPQTLQAADQKTLIDRLTQTQAVNIETIIDTQFEEAEVIRGFRVADPYGHETRQAVQLWSQSTKRGKELDRAHEVTGEEQ